MVNLAEDEFILEDVNRLLVVPCSLPTEVSCKCQTGLLLKESAFCLSDKLKLLQKLYHFSIIKMYILDWNMDFCAASSELTYLD